MVDDEEPLRRMLGRILAKHGLTARLCDSGAALFSLLDGARPACIVLDVGLPDLDGVQIQRELASREVDLPILFLSGRGSVALATGTLREGAFDFLEKPVDEPRFAERVAAALAEDARRVEMAGLRRRFEELSARELEVCGLLARGLASKQIGKQLSISVRTVEHHRERILQKTGTANTAEIVALYARVEQLGARR